MSEAEENRFIDKIVSRLNEETLCSFNKEERRDMHEYSRAKREANAQHGDIVNALLLGKSLNTWHIKGLNFAGFAVLVLLIWLMLSVSGLWDLILKLLSIRT